MEEWYNLNATLNDVHMLLTADETSYQGDRMESDHRLAGYHSFGVSWALDTALGHFDEA